nr:hypothetical protein [Tanacetum cinerariifolium]
MNNKKRIVNLEYFGEMLQICPTIPNQQFDELHFEEEILAFLRELGHSREIKIITDNTQQYGAILPVELTTEAIRNSKSYKEYCAIASGAEPPKTKASVRKKQTHITPPTAKGKRLKTLAKVDQPAKEKQLAKSSKAKGLTVLSEVALTEAEQIKLATKRSLTQTHISHASRSGADEGTDNDGNDFVHPKFSTHDEEDKDEESFDPIVQTPSQVENTDDEDNDEDSHGINVEGDEGVNEEDEANELYRDVNINIEGQDVQMEDVQTTQIIEDTHVTLTPVNPEGQQQSSSVSSRFVSNTLNPSLDTCIDFIFESTPRVDVPVLTTTELPLLSATTLSPPSIPIISHMNEAVKVDVRLQSDRLQDEAQVENEDFLNKFDENIQKIIKEQVKEQVKVQVSKILPKIENTVNEQLEAEVLTRSSNSSKTSHVVAADLSELELKKILIDEMESNKSIHRSDEKKNLYKALVDDYECDKLILDTYGDTVTLKRRQDDEDKDEEPSAGSNRRSKRRRAGKEPESTSAPKEKTSKTSGKSTEGSKSHHKTANESAPAEEPMHTTQDLEEPAHQEFVTCATDDQPSWINNRAKKADSHTSFNELMDTSVDFSAFVMNQLKVDTLTPELLAGPTYELMKGSCKSLVEFEFFLEEVYKATTDQLDWNNPEEQQYPHDMLNLLPLIPNSRGRHVIPFDHFINNDLEYLRGGSSSRKYTTSVTKTKAADYGHIKWIEDLVPRKMWSQVPVSYDKHALWRISHWGRKRVESYQKKLNLIKPDTYRSDLKRKESYTAYSNPRGFIYQNKDKQNKLMRIDELHKFSEGTLNDVRTALDDRLKGIQM